MCGFSIYWPCPGGFFASRPFMIPLHHDHVRCIHSNQRTLHCHCPMFNIPC